MSKASANTEPSELAVIPFADGSLLANLTLQTATDVGKILLVATRLFRERDSWLATDRCMAILDKLAVLIKNEIDLVKIPPSQGKENKQ